MMNRTGWLALLVLLALCSFVVPARAEDEDGSAPEPLKNMKATVDGMTKLVGATRLTDENVKLLLKHGPDFASLGKNEKGEDEVKEALEAHYKKTGTYDFAAILELAEIQAWGKKTGVDVRAFARAFLRYQGIKMREQFLHSAEKMRKELPKQLEQVEKMRSMMGEAAYKQAKQGLELQAKMADGMVAAAKSIPEATAAEKKLLAAHGAALAKALDMEDDDDEGMDDDDDEGMDDDDDDGRP